MVEGRRGLKHDSVDVDAETLARRFRDFARSFPDSQLYRDVTAAAADDPDVAGLLTSAPPGQARPVLLLAALHDLVLRRPDLPVGRWYPSVTGEPVPAGDPWPDVRRACLDHEDELRHTIATRSVQTNEVGRAATLAPLVAAAVSDVDAPIALVELGCSAGLLLNMDRYAIRVVHDSDVLTLGDPDSSVTVSTEAVQRPDRHALPRIAARTGIDTSPVDLGDTDSVRWLEACLWPDQVERFERFRAAVALGRRQPPPVVAGDMVDDLAAVLATVVASAPETHVVVMCSWSLTYVRRDRRPDIVATLSAAAADGRPVTWVSAEPDGAVPGIPQRPGPELGPDGTVLGIHRWRHGRQEAPQRWGLAHAHGAWFDRSR